MRVLVCLFLLALMGCPTPVCDPTETRCVGETAEICGSDGLWRVLMECGGEGMVCCRIEQDLDAGVPSGHTCLPTCPVVADGGE
jgi:hypothetical protein